MAGPDALAAGPLRDLVAAALLVFGGTFLTFGTLGVLRMPDVYNKLHAQTKATTLGLGSILLAFVVLAFPAPSATQALTGIAFLLITAPAAATAIARAGLRTGKGKVYTVEEDEPNLTEEEMQAIYDETDFQPPSEEDLRRYGLRDDEDE